MELVYSYINNNLRFLSSKIITCFKHNNCLNNISHGDLHKGNWNIRIILRNHLGIVTNIGPNQLENQNFQNYIHIDNVELGHSTFHSIPKEFSLNQNYPKPFNPLTTINFSVATQSKIKLTIYNIMGIEVAIILNDVVPAGTQSISWDANQQWEFKTSNGKNIPKGWEPFDWDSNDNFDPLHLRRRIK